MINASAHKGPLAQMVRIHITRPFLYQQQSWTYLRLNRTLRAKLCQANYPKLTIFDTFVPLKSLNMTDVTLVCASVPRIPVLNKVEQC